LFFLLFLRDQIGLEFPKNSFVDGCQAATGSSGSKMRRDRIEKRRAEEEEAERRKNRKRSWIPWS
jgi:beta-glucan synthesis-associated protein KRE6